MFPNNSKIATYSVTAILRTLTTTYALAPISFSNATTLESGRPKADFVVSEDINGYGHMDLLNSTKRKFHFLMKISYPRFRLPIPISVGLILGIYGVCYDI